MKRLPKHLKHTKWFNIFQVSLLFKISLFKALWISELWWESRPLIPNLKTCCCELGQATYSLGFSFQFRWNCPFPALNIMLELKIIRDLSICHWLLHLACFLGKKHSLFFFFAKMNLFLYTSNKTIRKWKFKIHHL